ncbi:hypothetical protein AS590_16770 [Prescottella equi]|uniref:Uncharacterized protein n=1 Tax=Rhodococcus qingshengii TaxID=334542 RepID=A0A2A5JIV5_RHOSG|nr:hypothetical protein [Rhodococcus qingshengii]MBQ7804193.1 hypothetical protein [Rhodococcus sp. (in: high G+C Gram-positive bacteria)]OCC21246.1 hypothetical protein AS590_16770 [Prescottella equi]QEX08917.1 hypothetical protein F6X56_03965 [Rhodococcus erythropolis]PCK29443.1 hypothetical protein CHR55_01255 [Rhodococcus qingshengii]
MFSPETASESTDLSVEGLAKIFRAAKDVEGQSVAAFDLGYIVSLLHPDRYQFLRIQFSLGRNVPRVPNLVNVTLPPEKQAIGEASRLLTAGVGDAIMKAIIEHWSPESARWGTREYRNAQGNEVSEIEVGWETYIQSGIDLDHSKLPVVAVLEELPNGTLIRLGEKPLDVNFDDILAVREALGYPV